MSKNKVSSKAFNIRLEKELWLFLKKLSAVQEKSMNTIIIEIVENHKKKIEKRIDI